MIDWLQRSEPEQPPAKADGLRLRRASAEYRGGVYERALATLDAAGAEGLSPAGHALRSDVLAALGCRDEALAAARDAWTARPERTDFCVRLATRLVEADRAGEAVTILMGALEVPAAAERILAGVAALNLDPAQIGLLYEASRTAFLRQSADASGNGTIADVKTEAEILAIVRRHVASWTGARRTPASVIVGRNERATGSPLFWCCQSEFEFAQLAGVLADRPVFAMRSGHLIIGYADEEVVALASSYARELMDLQPEGAFVIGGNCQGAFLARATALEIRKAGRDVDLLILMEESTFNSYDGRVALVFGRESGFNPYRDGREAATLDRAYSRAYAVEFIEGAHGHFFDDANLASLGAALENILKT